MILINNVSIVMYKDMQTSRLCRCDVEDIKIIESSTDGSNRGFGVHMHKDVMVDLQILFI